MVCVKKSESRHLHVFNAFSTRGFNVSGQGEVITLFRNALMVLGSLACV